MAVAPPVGSGYREPDQTYDTASAKGESVSLVREYCAENVERVPAAIEAGAGRIELCDNLAVGGTTPSFGVIRAAVGLARRRGVPVMTMIRPRGGDFAYTDAELAIMCDDIAVAAKLGSRGVVFGCAREGHLDAAATERLLEAVSQAARARHEHLVVTFHMAFDAIAEDEQFAVIDWLAARGVERILTHGGPAGTPIDDNLGRLRELMAHAAGRITILPGAGITWRNADHIAQALNAQELHGTKIVKLPE